MSVRLSVVALAVGLLASPLAGADEPETEAVAERARRLGAKFRAGTRCVAEPVAELRALQAKHGVSGWVGKGLALAYRGCEDRVAWASLMGELLEDDAPLTAKTRLGAAWLQARRFEHARAALAPVAEQAGADSQAAWLLGLALFHLGRHAEARAWLVGARGTVEGVVRSDVPVVLALSARDTGDPEGARAELRAAGERAPESAAVWATRAVVEAEHGDAEEAGHAARQAQERLRVAEVSARRRQRVRALRAGVKQAGDEGRGADAAQLQARLDQEPAATSAK